MTLLLLLVAAVALGYLTGSVSTATVVAARRGVDLRAVGSGNPGATNVGRALGRRAGVAVALLDVLKGAVPAAAFGEVDHRAGLVAGAAAVVGHVTSPFLRGRGGRGVATAAGAVLGSQPLWAPAVLAMWVLVVLLSRWVALASVSAAVTLLVVALVAGEDVLWAAVLVVVILVRHQPNLVRRLDARRASTDPPRSTDEG
jgi:glycerol-3-phosphate acyltransferase PlsY